MKVSPFFIVILVFTFYNSVFANYEKSIVRISSDLSLYDYKYPWKRTKRKTIVGSGVIIENQYILSAAHVVLGAKTIEVKKSGESKKYYAKVKYISPQADLALLEVYDKKFFTNTKSLKIASKVNLKDKITVAGYPYARSNLIIKKGKVSHIKPYSYFLSNEEFLALELDIEISQGNSGSPVLNKDDEIVGVAMQIPKDVKNNAYAVSLSIIKTFLEDTKDSKIDGFHSNSNSYQLINNKSLQEYYNIKQKGILVTDIDVEEKQLKVGDIILKNDSKLFSLFYSKPIGESIDLDIIRAGEKLNIDYKLNHSKKLIHQEFNKSPRYYIFGGLVFTPITRNYLQAIDIKQYEMDMLFYGQKKDVYYIEPVAWIETKFSHKINEGYNSKVEIVEKVNGIKVKSFKHFVNLIEKSKEKYIKIELVKKEYIILQKEKAIKSFIDIKNKYKLTKDKNL